MGRLEPGTIFMGRLEPGTRFSLFYCKSLLRYISPEISENLDRNLSNLR